MLSFFVITARRLVKEKFYALVCVLSLALGIASSLLISLYLQLPRAVMLPATTWRSWFRGRFSRRGV